MVTNREEEHFAEFEANKEKEENVAETTSNTRS